MHRQNFSKEPGMGSQLGCLYHSTLSIHWALIDQVAVHFAGADRRQAGLLEFIYFSTGVSATVVDGGSQISFGDVDYEFPVFCH